MATRLDWDCRHTLRAEMLAIAHRTQNRWHSVGFVDASLAIRRHQIVLDGTRKGGDRERWGQAEGE